MQELEEHMVLNPESKKSFDDDVQKSKAKAKQRVRKFTWFFVLCFVMVNSINYTLREYSRNVAI